MFNVNTSSIASAFAEYREENSFLITKFKRVAELLKRFKQYEHLEKNDVAKKGFFESSNNIVDLLKSLDLNINDFIKFVDDMIKSLEKEKTEMDKYFGNIKNTTIESIKHLERELLAFNHTQSDLMEKIKTYVPNVIALTDRVIAMEDETYEKQANKFASMFAKLKESLEKQVDKSHIFEALEEIILYAGSASRDLLRYLDSNPNGKIFLQNLIVRGKHFKRDLQGWMKKIGRDKDKDKTYSDLGEHEEKFDKFMKSVLEALFSGITLEDDGADVEAKKVIEKIIKPKTNFKELEGYFNENYDAVSNKIDSMGYVLVSNANALVTNLDELKYTFTNEKGSRKTLLFKKFKEEYLKDDKKKIPVLKEAVRYLGNMSTNKDTLKKFLDTQTGIQKSGSTSSSSDDEWYSSASEINSIDNLREVIDTLIVILSTLSTSSDNNWEELLRGAKSDLISDLKVIAKYVKKNGDRNLSGISIDLTIDSLKTYHSNFDKQVESRDALLQLVEGLEMIISRIRDSTN